MSGLTSELAAIRVGSKYDLILIAARRARELNRGWYPKISSNHSTVVTALQEIEQGHIGREYLLKPQNLHAKEREPKIDTL